MVACNPSCSLVSHIFLLVFTLAYLHIEIKVAIVVFHPNINNWNCKWICIRTLLIGASLSHSRFPYYFVKCLFINNVLCTEFPLNVFRGFCGFYLSSVRLLHFTRFALFYLLSRIVILNILSTNKLRGWRSFSGFWPPFCGFPESSVSSLIVLLPGNLHSFRNVDAIRISSIVARFFLRHLAIFIGVHHYPQQTFADNRSIDEYLQAVLCTCSAKLIQWFDSKIANFRKAETYIGLASWSYWCDGLQLKHRFSVLSLQRSFPLRCISLYFCPLVLFENGIDSQMSVTAAKVCGNLELPPERWNVAQRPIYFTFDEHSQLFIYEIVRGVVGETLTVVIHRRWLASLR